MVDIGDFVINTQQILLCPQIRDRAFWEDVGGADLWNGTSNITVWQQCHADYMVITDLARIMDYDKFSSEDASVGLQ